MFINAKEDDKMDSRYREVCIINFLIKNANFATLKIVHNFGVPKILQNLLAYRSLNKF